ASAHAGQVLDSRAGLLDVLEATGGDLELRDRGHRGVDVPEAVDVDADLPSSAEGVADRLDAGDVVGERLAWLGDLHLGGRAAAGGDDGVGTGGVDGGDGDVDGDPVAQGCGPVAVGGLDGAAQPRSGDLGRVLEERTPLAPPARTFEEHPL